MKIHRRVAAGTSAVAAALPVMAVAQLLQLEAHNHGEVLLTLVQDAGSVTLELITPQLNLLGFEHAPATEAERQALLAAEAALRQPGNWLQLDGEGCSTGVADLETSGEAQHAENHAENHADFSVRFAFTCANATLRGLTFVGFAAYPGIHEVELQWLVQGKAGTATLTAKDSSVPLP